MHLRQEKLLQRLAKAMNQICEKINVGGMLELWRV